MDPKCGSRLRQDSAIFVRTRIRARRQKFVKNRTRIRSHLSITAEAEVCVVVSLIKTNAGKSPFDQCSPESEQESDSQI